MFNFFLTKRTSANLNIATPCDFCCNCGNGYGENLTLIDTPLLQTRYFFIFGTELTIKTQFPYCDCCKRTAKRVRQGWMSKLLILCMLTPAMFLFFIFLADVLPQMLRENFFWSSVFISICLEFAYFYVQEWSRKDKTFYQPISLIDFDISSGFLSTCTLKFYNHKYADLIELTNQNLLENGKLSVVKA